MVTYKKHDPADQPKKVEQVEEKLPDPAAEKRVPPVEKNPPKK